MCLFIELQGHIARIHKFLFVPIIYALYMYVYEYTALHPIHCLSSISVSIKVDYLNSVKVVKN